MTSQKRIVFLHMQKTAGSDIAAQFYQSMFGKYFFPEELRGALAYLPRQILERYRFFYGHAYSNQERLNIPGDKLLFTFFRDPVERLISHYDWLASYRLDIENRIIPQPETIPVKMMSCEEFFCSAIVDNIPAFNNYYTRTIYEFFRDEKTNDITRMLPVALEKLQEFDFIGLLDSYSASLDCLGRMLDLRFDDSATRPKVNATVALPGENEFHEGGPRFNVSRETFQLILDRNWADIELYRQACTLARARFGLAEDRMVSGFSSQGVLHRGYDCTRFHIDTEGYLQFGPYERLNAGDHVVTFELRAAQCLAPAPELGDDAIVAVLDVVGCDGTEREFARREVRWAEIRPGEFAPFQVPVSTALPVSNLECRIYATGACELEAPVSVRIGTVNGPVSTRSHDLAMGSPAS